MTALKALILSCEFPGEFVPHMKFGSGVCSYMKSGDMAMMAFGAEFHGVHLGLCDQMVVSFRNKIAKKFPNAKTIQQAIDDGDIKFDDNGKEIIPN